MKQLQLKVARVVSILTLLVVFSAVQVEALDCFQCDSRNETTCSEHLPDDHKLFGKPCNEEDEYCNKKTEFHKGETWTKRSCSSIDWGNVCQWAQGPEGEYQVCISTCTGNNCNHAHFVRAPLPAAVTATALLVLLHRALHG